MPTSALFRQTDGAWAVFVVESGRARQRPVEIGQRSAEAAEVLSGLSEGDVVVLYPSNEVSDGITVH